MRTEAGRGESQPPTTGSQERGRGQSPPGPPGRHPPSQLLGLEFWPPGYERTRCRCRWPPGAAPAHSHWAPLGHAAPGERKLRASQRQLSPAGFQPTPLPPGPPEGPAQSPRGRTKVSRNPRAHATRKHITYRGALGSRETSGSLGSVGSLGTEHGQLSTEVISPPCGRPAAPTAVFPVLLVL